MIGLIVGGVFLGACGLGCLIGCLGWGTGFGGVGLGQGWVFGVEVEKGDFVLGFARGYYMLILLPIYWICCIIFVLTCSWVYSRNR